MNYEELKIIYNGFYASNMATDGKSEFCDRPTSRPVEANLDKLICSPSLRAAGATVIFVNDSNGQTVYQDPVWEELTGQKNSQALGRGWLDRVHADDRSMVEEAHCQAIDAACEYYIQYRLLTPNDDSKWVRVGAQASVGPFDRTFIGFLGSLVILPSGEAGTYRAYGQINRDAVHHVEDSPPSSWGADHNQSEVPESGILAGAPHFRQRIQSAIGLSRMARRHVGTDGSYRARVTLDMALIELAKEMERLKFGP